jgi:hypothetical protein
MSDLLGDHQLASNADDAIFRWRPTDPSVEIASGS